MTAIIASEPDRLAAPVYRVDKFVVPAESRAEFLERVGATHAVLRRQDGFVQDFILERESGPGEFNFVTFVEWTSGDVIERVSAEVAKHHAETGFDRAALFSRAGMKADIANYRRLEI